MREPFSRDDAASHMETIKFMKVQSPQMSIMVSGAFFRSLVYSEIRTHDAVSNIMVFPPKADPLPDHKTQEQNGTFWLKSEPTLTNIRTRNEPPRRRSLRSRAPQKNILRFSDFARARFFLLKG